MTLLFDGTYRETLSLLCKTRDFVQLRVMMADRRPAELSLRLKESCEAMRVTSRLSHVMAWLLLQKAVHQGELSAEHMTIASSRLGDRDICLTKTADDDLSPELQTLLEQSLQLYRRIERLDERVAYAKIHDLARYEPPSKAIN